MPQTMHTKSSHSDGGGVIPAFRLVTVIFTRFPQVIFGNLFDKVIQTKPTWFTRIRWESEVVLDGEFTKHLSYLFIWLPLGSLGNYG